MVSKLRARLPSHTTIAAYLSLFIALGGVSYAAVNLPKNSVDAKAIEKNAVKAPEIAKNAVKAPEIAANAVGSGEVTDGSLLCADFAPGQPACQAPGPDAVGLTNVTVRANTSTVPSLGTVVAQCAEGERATGGTAESALGGASAPESRPTPPSPGATPTGWQAQNQNVNSQEITVWVICAS
jgi:hypothetical protein